MLDIAPISVLLVGLLGLAVVLVGVARIIVAERQVVRTPVTRRPPSASREPLAPAA